MARRAVLVAVASLAVVLAATACGRQVSSDTVAVDANLDGRAVLASADKTAGANTGKVHLTMTAELSGVPTGSVPAGRAIPTAFSITGDGAYDRAAGLSSMTVDPGGMLEETLSALPAARRDEVAATVGGLDLTQHVVQQGTTTYLRSGALALIDPSLADRWLRLDASRLGGAGGTSGIAGIAGIGGTGDPSAYLDYLEGVGADVSTVGREQVGGVDTTHLRASVSMRQALQASGADRAALERSLGQLPGTAASALEELTFPTDVFVDGQGYVRRIRLTYDLRGLIQALGSAGVGTGSTKGTTPAGAGMQMVVTVDYTDLGAPVDITVPPPDRTVDVCEVASRTALRSKTTSSPPAGLC